MQKYHVVDKVFEERTTGSRATFVAASSDVIRKLNGRRIIEMRILDKTLKLSLDVKH
jgi:hypothetical protein